jgi:peptidoglycan/xylan/chitin deacetylase (PgdA/CDA1 family)
VTVHTDTVGMPPLSGDGVPHAESAPHRLRRRARRKVVRLLPRSLFGTITHVHTTEPVAALTFDDGPDPISTPRVLEVLQHHGAKATFFVLGKHAARYPRLIECIAQAGHAIANHSFDHPRFPTMSRRERIAQIRACEAAVTPYGHKLFRPPHGLQSIRSRLDALQLGYRIVTWTVVARDWEDHDPDWTADLLESQVKPGSIVLLHDVLYDARRESGIDRQAMITALDTFLSRNRARLTYVTVPELLSRGRPHMARWFVRSDADWAIHDPS